MRFYNYFSNYVDIMNEGQYLYALKERPTINTIVKRCLATRICRGELKSRWDKTNLRLSQMHMATL